MERRRVCPSCLERAPNLPDTTYALPRPIQVVLCDVKALSRQQGEGAEAGRQAAVIALQSSVLISSDLRVALPAPTTRLLVAVERLWPRPTAHEGVGPAGRSMAAEGLSVRQ